jgi:hypothetical protein
MQVNCNASQFYKNFEIKNNRKTFFIRIKLYLSVNMLTIIEGIPK